MASHWRMIVDVAKFNNKHKTWKGRLLSMQRKMKGQVQKVKEVMT
jgi:hypothetical protein